MPRAISRVRTYSPSVITMTSRPSSVRQVPEHRDETDEEQRDADGEHEQERPQTAKRRRNLRQDLLRSMRRDDTQTLNKSRCRHYSTLCHRGQLFLRCSHGAPPCSYTRSEKSSNSSAHSFSRRSAVSCDGATKTSRLRSSR